MSPVTSKPKDQYQTLMTVVCTVALLLFLVNCAFFQVAVLSYLTLGAFFAFAAVTTRSKGVVIPLAVFAGLGILSMPVAMVSYLVAGIGAIAVIAAAIRKGQYLTLLAIPAAYGVCVAVSGDPIGALGALVFLPPAVVMGVLLRKEAKRGTLIAATAGCILLLPIVSFAILAYTETGTVSLTFFTDYFFAFRDAFIPEMIAAFEEVGAPTADLEEILIQGFDAILLLFPALLVIACEIPAFLASVLGVALADTREHPLPLRTRYFRMETTSAVIFLIALVLGILLQGTDDTLGVIWISAQNLYLILLPALALQELFFFAERFRAGRVNLFFVVLFIALANVSLPYFLAVLGAFHLIRDSRLRHRRGGDDI